MLGIKLVLLVAVLAAGALGGAIPLRRASGGAASRGLAWGNAFAAGVFLGVGFLHMLPDAAESWERLGFDYPLGPGLAALAILGMLLIEHVLPPDEAHHALHAPSAERFGATAADPHAASTATAYAILGALGVHSLLAGLALGAQRELAGALVIFAAIVAHKTVEGFALGVGLARSALPRKRAWTLLWLFSLATPVGILIGSLADWSLDGRLRAMAEASFLALAAGTFAYVATLDILREEFHASSDRAAKWLWVALGTASMALLAIWL